MFYGGAVFQGIFIYMLLLLWPLVGISMYATHVWQSLRHPVLFIFLAIIIAYLITFAGIGCWCFILPLDQGEGIFSTLIELFPMLVIAVGMFIVHLFSRLFRHNSEGQQQANTRIQR